MIKFLPRIQTAQSGFLSVFTVFFLLCFFTQNAESTPIFKDAYVNKGLSNSVGMVQRGKSYYENKEYKKAVDLFWKALEAAPFNPEPYLFLLRIYSAQQDKQAFLKILERATKANTDVDYIFDHLTPSELAIDKAVPESGSLVSLTAFKGNKKAAITFCFDDGALSVYEKILPIFDKYGFKVTIPVNPINVHATTRDRWWGSWEQWRDASRRGHEIANHALSHKSLVGLPGPELDSEINQSYRIIKEKIGISSVSFIFPGDERDGPSMKKALEKHVVLRDHDFIHKTYKNVFLPVYGGRQFSLKTSNRIVDAAIKNQLWVIAECHAASTQENIKTYKPVTEEFIDYHLNYIKKRNKEIWVAPLREIYFYLMNRKFSRIVLFSQTDTSLVFSVESKLGKKSLKRPLTVLINLPVKDPTKVKISSEGSSAPLDFVAQDNGFLLIDVLPDSPPLKVSWTKS